MADVLLLLMLPSAMGWVTISASSYGASLENFIALQDGLYSGPALQTLGWLWHFPSDAAQTRGLGGSITWAWDDTLCPTPWRAQLMTYPPNTPHTCIV